MKLSELLAEMQKVLYDYGDLDMVVIRNGDIYPIIETCIDTDNNYYYIEAYKENIVSKAIGSNTIIYEKERLGNCPLLGC